MEYVTRGVCGQDGCRETRYYLDNGIWFCRRGHQQEGRQVEEDDDGFGPQGKIYRAKKTATEKIQKTLSGPLAYRLFLQAYQLILWKQCYALVQEKGFPEEIEAVVRDLWMLRLQALVDKFDVEEEDEDGRDADPLLFNSSQVPADLDPDPQTDEELVMIPKKASDHPRLVETLGLCYLAALLLRLPVSVGDIYRFALQGDIVFIRAVNSIPREMRDRMPPGYLSNLDTIHLLHGDHLHQTISNMAIMYHHEFGVTFPPLNTPLMLFEYLRQLALPIEIYPAVQRFQRLLEFNLSFSSSQKGTRKILTIPECQLLALIVVVTKLFFPLDEIKRYPTSAAEPATQVLDWKLWTKAQKDFEDRVRHYGGLGRGNEIRVNDYDVFHMSAEQVDEYMDWYEKSWLDNKGTSNPITEMFPTGRTGVEGPSTRQTMLPTSDEAIDAKLKLVMSQIQPRKVIPSKEVADAEEPGNNTASNRECNIPRPGSRYTCYRTESDLPENARIFFETAANLAGFSLKTLVKAVFQTELMIRQWQDDRRRADYHDEAFNDVIYISNDDNDDDDDDNDDDNDDEMEDNERPEGYQ